MRFVVTIVLAVVFVSVGCSSSGKEPPTSPVEAERAATAPGRTLVVGEGPPGSVVALEPLFEHDFAAPAGRTYMNQSGQMFIPGLLTARTGQEVEFRSSEDVLHNVRVDHATANKPIFNVATPPFGKYVHRLDQSGFYNVSCDIHTTMRATIFVTDAPYVAQIADTGAFRFRDVVPGPYKVTGFVQGKPIDKTIEASGPELRLTLP